VHVLLRDEENVLIGAAPLYLKDNSYGEFVFDWAWADAYRRSGLPYYPKLVSAIPYTPATGPRLLSSSVPGREAATTALIEGCLALADDLSVSSLHWLFTPQQETASLQDKGLLRRTGCQFHWRNMGWGDFEHMLADMTSRQRKKVRRERRRVRETGIRFRRLSGHDVSEPEWDTWHRLYCSTFERHSGIPTLSAGFFKEIARTMGEQVLLISAHKGTETVAAAFFLRSDDTLYGRHWGCTTDYHSLHFETCFYQGLEYCLEHGLTRFEPGAQGEHKISRGFLPVFTWSAHWIRDRRFRAAIDRHVRLEAEAVTDYAREMASRSPFKQGVIGTESGSVPLGFPQG
jgi:predicted N-acyltransferase